MAETRIFVYGRLQHQYAPPSTSQGWVPDSIRGRMFSRGEDPAVVDGSLGAGLWVHGETVTLDDGELAALDKAEAPYVRRRVRTGAGHTTWVYVWPGPVPLRPHWITHWVGPKLGERGAATPVDLFKDVQERNRRNAERMAKERAAANHTMLRDYRIKP